MSRRREASDLARALLLSTQEAGVISKLSPQTLSSGSTTQDSKEMELRVLGITGVDGLSDVGHFSSASGPKDSYTPANGYAPSAVQAFTPTLATPLNPVNPNMPSRVSASAAGSPIHLFSTASGIIPSSGLSKNHPSPRMTPAQASRSSDRPGKLSPTQTSAPAPAAPPPIHLPRGQSHSRPVTTYGRAGSSSKSVSPVKDRSGKTKTNTNSSKVDFADFPLSSSPDYPAPELPPTPATATATGTIDLSSDHEVEEVIEATRSPTKARSTLKGVIIPLRTPRPQGTATARDRDRDSPDPLAPSPALNRNRESSSVAESQSQFSVGEPGRRASKRVSDNEAKKLAEKEERKRKRREEKERQAAGASASASAIASSSNAAAAASSRRTRRQSEIQTHQALVSEEDIVPNVSNEDSIQVLKVVPAPRQPDPSEPEIAQSTSRRKRGAGADDDDDEDCGSKGSRTRKKTKKEAAKDKAKAKSALGKVAGRGEEEKSELARKAVQEEEDVRDAPEGEAPQSPTPAKGDAAPVLGAEEEADPDTAQEDTVAEEESNAEQEPVLANKSHSPARTTSARRVNFESPIPLALATTRTGTPSYRPSPGPRVNGRAVKPGGIQWQTARDDLSSVLSKFAGSKTTGMSRKFRIAPLHTKIGPPAKALPPVPLKPIKKKKGEESDDDEEGNEGKDSDGEDDGEVKIKKGSKEWLMMED